MAHVGNLSYVACVDDASARPKKLDLEAALSAEIVHRAVAGHSDTKGHSHTQRIYCTQRQSGQLTGRDQTSESGESVRRARAMSLSACPCVECAPYLGSQDRQAPQSAKSPKSQSLILIGPHICTSRTLH